MLSLPDLMAIASRSSFPSIVAVLAVAGIVTFLVGACGSSADDKPDDVLDGQPPPGSDTDGGFGSAKPDTGDTFAKDPPPTYCVLAGQSTPPKPGGTEACPDDKNLPGCGCTTLGEETACWTGLRVNRKLGQCKDGRTKCIQTSENTKAWGPCEGEVLPRAGRTKGADACKCFSLGQWKLANTSPCFVKYPPPSGVTYALSTVTDGTGVTPLPIGQAECPKYVKNGSPPPAKPASDWSTDTLKADCAGRFTLCYEVKAGNVDAPSPTDCTLAKVCVSADYLKANEEQAFPPLGPWVSDNTTCVAQFTTTGGYGEMTVIGESVLCDKVDDGAGRAIVFNRVKYCSPSCSGASKAPECTNCGQGAGGTF